MLFNKLLVANRGEIAIRIFRAAAELEIRTVGIYSHEDRFALHRYKADEAYKLGTKGAPLGAYLDWHLIVDLAEQVNADAIHPGYGFLSENPEFAQACLDRGIVFIGPPPSILRLFGDKLSAKKTAIEAKVPVIPGPVEPVPNIKEAEKIAKEIGYPVTVKALSGGGGKGIRIVHSQAELKEAFERARSEAQSSFGSASIYLEKTLLHTKHLEVQIAGDVSGNIVHLYERDCSVQRRHQKVVEMAPALGISNATRKQLHEASLKVAKHVGYNGLGTVEFLVDRAGEAYFLEVNPRIQVEHTVTELVTGYDLVQASIALAAGRSLSHPAIGITSQDQIKPRGVAIQCRITTEDPKNEFAPDTGRILAYRPPQGFGIRLDEGHGTSGGKITPYYDSLLVKITASALDLYGATRKMLRALREFRLRGLKTNIPLLLNILSHKRFLDGSMTTAFLAEHPELYDFPTPRDRATKILNFIAEATVNNPHELAKKEDPSVVVNHPLPTSCSIPTTAPKENAKAIYDKAGSGALAKWVKAHDRVLLTDTTMRDAHQSLFATRMRTIDMLRAAPYYRGCASGLFSLEVWGGATFDTCLRFLKEDPWERLARLREEIPNILLQMLLRGDNAVGYTNYPEWVIRDFIRLTVQTGLDLFRIFDCLNNPEQMEIAIDEVRKQGAICEPCICYTGNVSSPEESKYTIKYYVDIAKRLEKMGGEILCIKDMAGLLRPQGAADLIKALKDNTELPIHLHTHATSGNAGATILAAATAGCDIIDGAISSMSGLTSQPSINALVAALENDPIAPETDLLILDDLSRYWESVRSMYKMFDPGIQATSTAVYEHEIPGGQYSNLYDQARKVGLSGEEFFELTKRYQEVNDLFGNIIKVTPSSKVVGDMALLLQKHGLTGPEWKSDRPKLDYPDSVLSFHRGEMGVPYGGFDETSREIVLGKEAAPAKKSTATDNDSFDVVKAAMEEKFGRTFPATDVLSYRLYPKVFKDYRLHLTKYGKLNNIPTPIFFHGMPESEEVEVDLEKGKTLIIVLRGISEIDKKGMRRVFFDLNGYPRQVTVLDATFANKTTTRPKVDPTDTLQIGAAMPGKVFELRVKAGDSVASGDVVMVTESMKMEYAVTAKTAATVEEILVRPGDLVESGDLMIQLKS